MPPCRDTIKKVARGIPADTIVMVYADDILFVGGLYNLGRIMQCFETHLPDMPFTLEFEAQNRKGVFSIMYLELDIQRTPLPPAASGRNVGSCISTCWAQKPYHSLATLHFLSEHTWETKHGVITEMLSKAINLSSSAMLLAAFTKWFDILLLNRYPAWILVNVAYDYVGNNAFMYESRKAIAAALGRFCSSKGLSKADPSHMNRKRARAIAKNLPGPLSVKKRRLEEEKKAYISFPMGAGLRVLSEPFCLTPSLRLAPNASTPIHCIQKLKIPSTTDTPLIG